MAMAVSVSIIFPVFAGNAIAPSVTAPSGKDPAIAILFTNDVHSYYDSNIGYDGLMLMKKELELKYEHVILVDAGDAVQGAPLGALSQGQEPIRIMNEVGYDIAILGNHEFDYGLEVLDALGEQLNCGYICANFCTPDGATVYDPYRILTYDDTSVAFISVDTPTAFSKSGLHNLIDDLGNPMYDFKADVTGEPLYDCLQGYIDEVRENGADCVILVAHLGNRGDAEKAFQSEEVVSHLNGLDAVIDGHSHETYNTTATDADGKEIPIAQTGCNFQNVGTMILHPDKTITVSLYDEIPAPEDWMEGIEAITVTRDDRERYVDAEMHQLLEEITVSYADIMNRRVGEVDYDMLVRTEDDYRLSRHTENGLCNLVADVFRETTRADIGLVNAGSVRNSLPAGEITFNSVLNMLPYSDDVQIAEVTGQTLLDALEFSCRLMPEPNGGFLQVSGMEFTVDLSVDSPVVTDETGAFLRIEGARRVSDVMIDGEPLDPETIYTVASTAFLFTGGDNYRMLADDAEVVELTGKTDNIMVADYIEDNLNGVIPESYQNTGDRIHIIDPARSNPVNEDILNEDILTEEQALEAIRNYCYINNPDLKGMEESEDYTIYWEVSTNEDKEIVVLYRSYTSAQVRYYIDPSSGETYVTEYVPGITDEEEKTDEFFNVRDYQQ